MSPQHFIAHYRITSRLGKGGMGEVWRATDTKLNREVAIKFLPDAFAADANRMARFAREAQVLASLNHPNIAAIYGVEERALIMELIPGPTLAERIAQGPIPTEESLGIARQIAEALQYAHERGVIHRDLKPANIKVTPEGRAKVLDFGLAKALTAETAADDPASSPTLTMNATVAGVIMGTAAYMAPEQARGKVVDKRVDIWAFGVVLYEMLTGQTLFAGEGVSDTLAALLTKEPDLGHVPAQVRDLLRSCLEKDPKRRLRDIGDAWRLVNEKADIVPARGRSEYLGRALRLVAMAMTMVALVLAIALWRATRPVDHLLTRLTVDLGAQLVSSTGIRQNHNSLAISPDGHRLVFRTGGPEVAARLATRTLDEPEALVLPGTESGHDPFFSPDGQWIGFFARNGLSKVSVLGGAPINLCTSANVSQGASWTKDGTIVASLSAASGLVTIPDTGGAPQPLTRLRPGEGTHRWPQVLPGGKAVLFTAAASTGNMEDAVIKAADLKTGTTKTIHRGGYYGRYLPGGYLVYVHRGVLFGVRFDPDSLHENGTPVPLLSDILGDSGSGAGQFDVSGAPSGSGALIYVAGNAAAQAWTLTWLDGAGKTTPLITIPGIYFNPVFSPDGRSLALVAGPAGGDVFVYDLDRKRMMQLTFDGASDRAVWAPDGKHIVARSNASGLWWIRADGAGQPQLLNTPRSAIPWSISPNGRRLAYWEINPTTASDIDILPLDTSDPDHPKPGKPEPFLHTAANEAFPVFSPDGRWIAYRSDELGVNEIWVQPASGGGGKWKISSGGGLYAVWARNGRQLFYESADNRIIIVEYTVDGDSFVPGEHRVWYDHPLFSPGRQNLTLASDDKRFAVFKAPEASQTPTRVVLLLNFFDWLKRKIP
jgi:Tol biopolymer transport system component/predicted Ser/Thr protein kinase